MTTLIRTMFLTIALLGSSAGAVAQFATVSGSGCPGALPIATTGAPKINTTPTLDCPCPPFTNCVIGIGVPMPCVIVPGPWCHPACCIACNPLIWVLNLSSIATPIPIPNDNTLVNAKFCAQCFCVSGTCVKISQALDITIQC